MNPTSVQPLAKTHQQPRRGTSRVLQAFYASRDTLTAPLLRLTAVATMLAAISVSAQAPLDVRVALIIGNSAYAGNMALVNPANDAKAMADVLKRLGFNVIELRDGSKAQMSAAIAKISESLKGKQGVGMLYYAGHGLQLDWHNYMVPVDANLKSAADVQQQTIDLSSVVDIFKAAGNRMNIVVLDACRDNPFGGNTSSAKGLAQLDAPPSTFLAYATAPGNVAEDGDVKSGNGLYTQFLLQELKRPTAKIEDVFKRVQLNVRKQSNGRQIPWESTSLEDDFFFNDGVKYTIKAEDLERMAAEVRQIEQKRLAQEAEALERIEQAALAKERERQQAEAKVLEQLRVAAEPRAKEAERLGAVAKAQAQEKLAAEAKLRDQQRLAQEAQAREREQLLAFELTKEKARLATEAQAREQQRLAQAVESERLIAISRVNEQTLGKEQQKELLFNESKTAWEKIKASTNSEDFYIFLQRFPGSGELSQSAEFRLNQLAKPQVTASVGKGQDASLAYTGLRFKVGDRFEIQSTDLLTGLLAERTVWNVTAIEVDVIQINGGQRVLTPLGATLKNDRAQYEPFNPNGGGFAAYQVGKKSSNRFRQNSFDGRTYDATSEAKITGRETITVPAGTFQTFVIERAQFYSDGTSLKVKSWLDPRYGVPIRIEELQRRSKGGEVLNVRRELVAITANRS